MGLRHVTEWRDTRQDWIRCGEDPVVFQNKITFTIRLLIKKDKKLRSWFFFSFCGSDQLSGGWGPLISPTFMKVKTCIYIFHPEFHRKTYKAMRPSEARLKTTFPRAASPALWPSLREERVRGSKLPTRPDGDRNTGEEHGPSADVLRFDSIVRNRRALTFPWTNRRGCRWETRTEAAPLWSKVGLKPTKNTLRKKQRLNYSSFIVGGGLDLNILCVRF